MAHCTLGVAMSESVEFAPYRQLQEWDKIIRPYCIEQNNKDRDKTLPPSMKWGEKRYVVIFVCFQSALPIYPISCAQQRQ